jgi:hypothetical protein
LGEVWSDFVETFLEGGLESWSPFFRTLEEWIHPRYPIVGDEKYRAEHEAERFALVRRMLRDLKPLASCNPGAIAGLRRLASRVELDIDLKPDETFELLYPTVEDRETRGTRLEDDLTLLAVSWVAQPASETLEQLQLYADEARRIGHGWPRLDSDLCRHLAERTDSPASWVDEAMDRGLPAELVYPFLKRLVEQRREGFRDTVRALP